MAVPSFKYLGRILSSTDSNWQSVERNLQRAQEKWGEMVHILGREWMDKRTAGKFYMVVVQVVLFFG